MLDRQPAEAPQEDARTILVVGVGSVGLRHLRNLRVLGHGKLAAQRTGLGTLPVEDEDVTLHRDLDAALESRPLAAIVTNPTSMHLETALRAAKAGAHLFIEKPLSHSAAGVPGLRNQIGSSHLVAQVGFQFRFHPTLARVKGWLEEGAVGRVVSAHVHWSEWLRGWHPWEDYRRSYSARHSLGGGVIRTLCHPFDYLRWLLGEVTGVFAQADRLSTLELDVEDTAVITLRFESGALATVYLDCVGRPRRHSLEIVGCDGRIRWDDQDGVAQLFEGGRRGAHTARPPAGFERNRLFLDEMAHFLGRVRAGDSDLRSLDDGIRALEITLAAARSAEIGSWVRV
jgi:predicted dehydrogenase